MWDAHLKSKHLLSMNDFCGIIRQCSVIVVAAYCLFCIGNVEASLSIRFEQFHDVYVLHEHMKSHLREAVYPLDCPHPLCGDNFDTEELFWKHAISVHGTPPFATPKTTGKRKSPSDDGEDGGVQVGDSGQDLPQLGRAAMRRG
jgi:hypothetical protein